MKIQYSLRIKFIFCYILFCLKLNAQQWNPIPAAPEAFVKTFVIDTSNNLLIVGGAFSATGTMNNWFIAGWNGATWNQIGTGSNFLGSGIGINYLTFYDNELFAGGDFTNPAVLVAKYDGSNWDSVNNYLYSGTYPSGNMYVNALKSFNNKLYITGSFRYKDYVTLPDTVNSIITWDGMQCDRLTDSTGTKIGLSYFSTSWGFVGNALYEFNNELYIAGVFDTICGVAAPSKVAKTDGQNWFPVGQSLPIVPLSFQSYDNNLFVGGNGDYIHKFDGTNWIPFADIKGPNTTIFAMTVYHNDLVIAGIFDSVESCAAKNIARWNGTSWSAFSSGLTNFINSASVFALAEFQGDLYAGGGFSQAGGIPAENIARWSEPIGIDEINKEKINKIYPNPSSTFLNVEMNSAIKIKKLLIFNSPGECVKTFAGTDSYFIGDLPMGSYAVQITTEDGKEYSQKIIIQ